MARKLERSKGTVKTGMETASKQQRDIWKKRHEDKIALKKMLSEMQKATRQIEREQAEQERLAKELKAKQEHITNQRNQELLDSKYSGELRKLMSQKKEIDEQIELFNQKKSLEDANKKDNAQMAKITRSISNEIKTIRKNKRTIDNIKLRLKLQLKKPQKEKLNGKLEKIEKLNGKLEIDVRKLEGRKKELQDFIENNDERLSKISRKVRILDLETLEIDSNNLDIEIQIVRNKIAEQLDIDKFRELNLELVDLKIESISSLSSKSDINSKINRIQNEIDKLTPKIDDNMQEIIDLEVELHKLEVEKENINEKQENIRKKQSDIAIDDKIDDIKKFFLDDNNLEIILDGDKTNMELFKKNIGEMINRKNYNIFEDNMKIIIKYKNQYWEANNNYQTSKGILMTKEDQLNAMDVMARQLNNEQRFKKKNLKKKGLLNVGTNTQILNDIQVNKDGYKNLKTQFLELKNSKLIEAENIIETNLKKFRSEISKFKDSIINKSTIVHRIDDSSLLEILADLNQINIDIQHMISTMTILFSDTERLSSIFKEILGEGLDVDFDLTLDEDLGEELGNKNTNRDILKKKIKNLFKTRHRFKIINKFLSKLKVSNAIKQKYKNLEKILNTNQFSTLSQAELNDINNLFEDIHENIPEDYQEMIRFCETNMGAEVCNVQALEKIHEGESRENLANYGAAIGTIASFAFSGPVGWGIWIGSMITKGTANVYGAYKIAKKAEKYANQIMITKNFLNYGNLASDMGVPSYLNEEKIDFVLNGIEGTMGKIDDSIDYVTDQLEDVLNFVDEASSDNIDNFSDDDNNEFNLFELVTTMGIQSDIGTTFTNSVEDIFTSVLNPIKNLVKDSSGNLVLDNNLIAGVRQDKDIEMQHLYENMSYDNLYTLVEKINPNGFKENKESFKPKSSEYSARRFKSAKSIANIKRQELIDFLINDENYNKLSDLNIENLRLIMINLQLRPEGLVENEMIKILSDISKLKNHGNNDENLLDNFEYIDCNILPVFCNGKNPQFPNRDIKRETELRELFETKGEKWKGILDESNTNRVIADKYNGFWLNLKTRDIYWRKPIDFKKLEIKDSFNPFAGIEFGSTIGVMKNFIQAATGFYNAGQMFTNFYSSVENVIETRAAESIQKHFDSNKGDISVYDSIPDWAELIYYGKKKMLDIKQESYWDEKKRGMGEIFRNGGLSKTLGLGGGIGTIAFGYDPHIEMDKFYKSGLYSEDKDKILPFLLDEFKIIGNKKEKVAGFFSYPSWVETVFSKLKQTKIPIINEDSVLDFDNKNNFIKDNILKLYSKWTEGKINDIDVDEIKFNLFKSSSNGEFEYGKILKGLKMKHKADQIILKRNEFLKNKYKNPLIQAHMKWRDSTTLLELVSNNYDEYIEDFRKKLKKYHGTLTKKGNVSKTYTELLNIIDDIKMRSSYDTLIKINPILSNLRISLEKMKSDNNLKEYRKILKDLIIIEESDYTRYINIAGADLITAVKIISFYKSVKNFANVANKWWLDIGMRKEAIKAVAKSKDLGNGVFQATENIITSSGTISKNSKFIQKMVDGSLKVFKMTGAEKSTGLASIWDLLTDSQIEYAVEGFAQSKNLIELTTNPYTMQAIKEGSKMLFNGALIVPELLSILDDYKFSEVPNNLEKAGIEWFKIFKEKFHINSENFVSMVDYLGEHLDEYRELDEIIRKAKSNSNSIGKENLEKLLSFRFTMNKKVLAKAAVDQKTFFLNKDLNYYKWLYELKWETLDSIELPDFISEYDIAQLKSLNCKDNLEKCGLTNEIYDIVRSDSSDKTKELSINSYLYQRYILSGMKSS